jgi:uncharacterized protein (TIGR00299 family) protein
VIAYLDCTTGISGDKFLAALVDAGAPRTTIREAIAAIDPTIAVEFAEVSRAGIRALSAIVTTNHTPVSRTWADVRSLIEGAHLAAEVRDTALGAFTLLAEAEAAVHGVGADEVHFHEVGGADSIADIVGTAAGLHALHIDEFVCSPVSVGGGTVDTAHGTLPVPAPATAMLLVGVPIEAGPLPGEATTPTGAALARACAQSFGSLPPMTVEHIGHGAGTRDPAGVANIARLFLSTAPEHTQPTMHQEAIAELQTTIDHLSAEHLAFACEELLAAGALDVWQTPALMKKGRAGTAVTVVCRDEDATQLATLTAELTGTLGVRIRRVTRVVAERHSHTVMTSLGEVRVKTAGAAGWRRSRIEYEDLAAIARREGLPIDVVARELGQEL